MYVDGHKAASDVRDEFVSVTEKLMDELAQCYNVLPQLDINSSRTDRKSGSAGMPRPISYAVFCLKKKKIKSEHDKNTIITYHLYIISILRSSVEFFLSFFFFFNDTATTEIYTLSLHDALPILLTAIRLLLTFVMSLYLLLRS